MGTDGGWALYLLDKVGVISFGRYWPVAGWTALATLVIGLLTALVWSLKACEKWVCCGCGCGRRGLRDGLQAVDPALRHLPVTPAPAAYATVTLVGPGSSTPVDTEYFQRQVRGRGTGRRPHDLVLRFPQGAVRMQPDWTHRTRIDRHGLWVKPGRILGVTARALRDHLERADQIHLCRTEGCTQPGEYHCKEFAAIDPDSVIDLGGRLDSWRALVLLWRGLRSLRKVLASCLRCCSCRRPTEVPRHIQDPGVIRPLDPDSESEAEQISDPCEAVLIGLELQGKPRALAPEGCEDRAAAEPTRLLVDDLQLSDLGARECARLCNHHSQLYMLSCQGRKCSVVSCFNKVHGAHKGTPRCSKHLAETGRSNSPAPTHGTAKRKPEESLLHSIRKSQSADTRLEHGPSRAVRFEEPSSPVTERQRHSSSEYEKPSRAERSAHPKSGAPVLVRLHPFFGAGVKTHWFLFLGEVEGIAEDSRRTERAAVKIPALGLRVSLPWHCLGEPPLTDQLEERDVSIQVNQVASRSWEWLKEWEGKEVRAKDTPSANLRPEQLRQLVKEPRLVLLPHDEGPVPRSGNQSCPAKGCSALLAPGGGPPDAVARLFPTAGHDAQPGLVSAAAGALAIQQPSLGLGQGLVRKAGAAFGEQLGPGNPTLATDRIIHAIDGLRKAQDEDKTGSKGQVSSIKEGAKLDAFLARGCGQLSIELCEGVDGKELFHSIKRAGLHAKHRAWPDKMARVDYESSGSVHSWSMVGRNREFYSVGG